MENVLLESDRLLIRHPEEGDKQSLERVFGDPAMIRYLGEAWTPAQVMEALQWWRDNWGVNNCWYGILLRKDTLEVIGTAGFTENTIPGEPGLALS
jgi:RimJ/RimL family protein N-acetyltransferase